MKGDKKILLICYAFPPYPGIGGRRWVKFAKYLRRRGHQVTVIASENPYPDKVSEWSKDAEQLTVHQLPLNFPKALITFPGGISGRIRYRLALQKVKRQGKGNYYDRALFWEKPLLKEASALIEKEGIKNVIVSGAPFHLVHHASKLKKMYPEIHFIADFRDLWVADDSLSALGSLDEERKKEEARMEEEVCKAADVITCVSEEMAAYFNKIAGSTKARVVLNGYDTDDFKGLRQTEKKEDRIRFVFTGNLYNNLDPVFKPFCEALLRIKKEKPDIYKKLRFDFYGTSAMAQREIVKEKELGAIHFHAPVSLQKTLEEINASDYCLLFLNDVYAFSLSTKFCEYIALRKPIVLFSKKGKASEFIETNGLGWWIDPDAAYESLLKMLNTEKNSTVSDSFDYAQFSVENIVTELERYLV
jgi:glycosyltransferase involved in cell wall biosynthesis